MSYRQITDHSTPSKAALDAALARLDPMLGKLKARQYADATPLLDLPARVKDLPDIDALARDIQKSFRHLIVVGAGGSGLSGRTLAKIGKCDKAQLHFLDNIDPDDINNVLPYATQPDSCFLVISKSGSTAETLAQFYVLFEASKKAAGRFIIITLPGDNPLRRAAEQHGIRVLNHEADIGGRFSILTNVGLLPGAVCGLDIKALRRGAADVVKAMDEAPNAAACAPALGAALQFAFMGEGRNISVMLPYSKRLSGFSSWYRQSWAESLGKGGKGSTPVRALGSTDQHSQLQLYLDGPKDKLFHLITIARAGTGQKIHAPNHPELAYLQGRTTGDIMAAEQKATLETLVKNGCPVRVFELPRLTEVEMGALLMHFMLEIIFMGELLGVNPFDQPAVEESKRRAREYLQTGKL